MLFPGGGEERQLRPVVRSRWAARGEAVGGSTKRGVSGRIGPPRSSDNSCTVERIVRSADGRGS